jgi:hypothetical protein
MPMKPRKHANVEIQFNQDIPVAHPCTVLLRDGEMVIDMQDPGRVTKYLIVGKSVKYFFQGINTAGPQMPKVLAKWVQLGNIFVGHWLEEGQEYLFSFELKD